MSRTLQFKRYANTAVANTTGASGELIIDTTNKTITVHDGTTAGGSRIATEIYVTQQINSNYSIDGQIFDKANTANVLAQSAFNQANTANVLAQSAFNTANTANVLAQSAFNQANTANVLAQSAFNTANTANASIQPAFNQANTANVLAQSAFNTANTASSNTIYLQGGLNTANSNTAYLQGALNTANTNINAASQTVPQNAQTTNYTLVNSDAGKHLYYTQSANVNLYIPWSSNASFANGTTIMVVSRTTSSANVTVTPNTGVTMYLAGNTTSASRNVTTYGMATLIQVAANTWFINGTGVA
jgi:hypothetical protein